MNSFGVLGNKGIRRTILITGASGGIGRATALAVADDCEHMLIHGNRHGDVLKELATTLRQRGIDVDVLNYDLSDEMSQNAFTDSVLSHMTPNDRMTGAVFAAGVDLMAFSRRRGTGDEKLRQILAVDVAAAVRISRRIGLFMKGQEMYLTPGSEEDPVPPVMVFFGWDGVRRGMAGETAELYALAKGAISAYARSLAQSLAPSVRCVTVAPGWIRTTWGETASKPSDLMACDDSLARRWGAPDEVAKVVRFLLSRDASFVNAEEITVSGGYRARTNKQEEPI